LQELASWAGFIVALDAGGQQLRRAGLKPDLLLGDFDSLSPECLAYYEAQGVLIERHDAYKNATDIELGIEALCLRGYHRILATNVLGGRADHSLGALGALAGAVCNKGMEIVLRDEREACFFVNSNKGGKVQGEVKEGRFSCCLTSLQAASSSQAASSVQANPCFLPYDLPCPRHLSLVTWGGSATVSLKGVEWELDHHSLSPHSTLGISNVARSPHWQLTVHEGSATVLFLLTFG